MTPQEIIDKATELRRAAKAEPPLGVGNYRGELLDYQAILDWILVMQIETAKQIAALQFLNVPQKT